MSFLTDFKAVYVRFFWIALFLLLPFPNLLLAQEQETNDRNTEDTRFSVGMGLGVTRMKSILCGKNVVFQDDDETDTFDYVKEERRTYFFNMLLNTQLFWKNGCFLTMQGLYGTDGRTKSKIKQIAIAKGDGEEDWEENSITNKMKANQWRWRCCLGKRLRMTKTISLLPFIGIQRHQIRIKRAFLDFNAEGVQGTWTNQWNSAFVGLKLPVDLNKQCCVTPFIEYHWTQLLSRISSFDSSTEYQTEFKGKPTGHIFSMGLETSYALSKAIVVSLIWQFEERKVKEKQCNSYWLHLKNTSGKSSLREQVNSIQAEIAYLF